MNTVETEWLTPTEAAVVAGISVRNVHRTVDENILPRSFYRISKDGVRQISSDACVLLSFYFEAANRLTAEERLRIVALANEKLHERPASSLENEWVIHQEFLTIDLAPFLRAIRQRLARLQSARAMVVEDPEILSGTPVFRGTRIPVYQIAAIVAAGEPVERILEDYSSLTAEAIALARFYAEANPMRGRPRQPWSLPAGAVLISSYSVPLMEGFKKAS